MTPAARVADAIALVDQVIAATRDNGAAADTLAQRFFAARRYAGSKDRRAIRALVWQVLRTFADPPPSGRAAMVALADADADLAALFDGTPYGPPPISAHEPRAQRGGALPAAIASHFYPFIDDVEVAALMERAPVDVRINRAKAGHAEFPSVGEPLPQPLDGLRFRPDTNLVGVPAYDVGAMEIQDAGSQWIVEACAARPGQRIVDLCAGAGGKTLALWAAMQGQGQLLACDSDRRRLGELAPRAARAGADGIKTRVLNMPCERDDLADWRVTADLVLIDAPCSGSGTWRRNPEARWRVTPDRVARLAAQQARLLDIGAELVAPGGALVYAVCSLTRAEGQGAVEAFLTRQPGWTVIDMHRAGLLPTGIGRSVGPGIVLTPHHDATDGFFFARLQAG